VRASSPDRENNGAGPSWIVPPAQRDRSRSVEPSRAFDAVCLRPPTFRSIRSPTATWPRVSLPPAARFAPVIYSDGSAGHAQLYGALGPGWRHHLAGRAPRIFLSLRYLYAATRRGEPARSGVVAVEPVGVGGVGASRCLAWSRSAPRTAARLGVAFIEPDAIRDVVELGDEAREQPRRLRRPSRPPESIYESSRQNPPIRRSGLLESHVAAGRCLSCPTLWTSAPRSGPPGHRELRACNAARSSFDVTFGGTKVLWLPASRAAVVSTLVAPG